jgi:hypothetical protein
MEGLLKQFPDDPHLIAMHDLAIQLKSKASKDASDGKFRPEHERPM